MIGPSSQGSKILLVLFILLLLFFVWMDYNLYQRIQNFPREYGTVDNETSYEHVSWIKCEFSPLCVVTVKALILDHVNHYLFAPLVLIVDNVFEISQVEWITPNSISFFHVFVAFLSAKCISSDSLSYRRLGILLFEVRSFLDDLDGHVARVRKHLVGEQSEIGTSGYYVDGICDGIGTIALLVGAFVFLKNNPPRRGYMQLPSIVTNDNIDRDTTLVYKANVTTKKVARQVLCFSIQLLMSSTAWNRYIAVYQDILDRNDVSKIECAKQDIVFRSSFFLSVAWLWRIVNVHTMVHIMLLAVFCDKLWEFLKWIQYIGFAVLLSVICVTEVHIVDVQNFIFRNQASDIMNN